MPAIRREREYLIVKTDVPCRRSDLPEPHEKFVAAYRFERQMQSLMGVIPVGHPDARPWIKHEDWPEKPGRSESPLMPRKLPRVPGEYRWIRAEGEGVYEIPVGPVHAGIIEPGHFRFQAVGEEIINLEERLGYVHKGIEKRFESLSWKEAARLAGRVSGDTTVAHAWPMPRRWKHWPGASFLTGRMWLRALFLERERIANHLGDLGAICNDVAFAFLLYQFHRLKEHLLRTNHRLFGHRFMMDRVVPGGVTVDIDDAGVAEILAELDRLAKEFERLVVIYDENPSLEDRVRDTGMLKPEQARDLGMVGFVARASGLNLDCRIHHPFPPYDRITRERSGADLRRCPCPGLGAGGRDPGIHQDHPRDAEDAAAGSISVVPDRALAGPVRFRCGRRMARRDPLLGAVRPERGDQPLHGQGPVEPQLAGA